MPNPNEMHRKEIEMRNLALKSYETSRNMPHYLRELEECVEKVKTTLPKGDKERLLSRIRELERLTGKSVGNYNSNNFGLS